MKYSMSQAKKVRPKKLLTLTKSWRLSVRREFTEAEQALVIFLRYGSLTDAGTRWLRSKDVFLRTGILPQSQCAIIRRWRLRNFTIVRDRGRRGARERLTPEQVQWVVSIETL